MHASYMGESMKFIAFWEQKSRPEKCFWGVFFAGVIVFLFYHFSFEALLENYRAQKTRQNLAIPIEKPLLPKTKASVLLEEILNKARALKITQIDSRQGIVNVKGNGEFAPLMRWFYFLESFRQVFILNFKFSYTGELEFEVAFEIRE